MDQRTSSLELLLFCLSLNINNIDNVSDENDDNNKEYKEQFVQEFELLLQLGQSSISIIIKNYFTGNILIKLEEQRISNRLVVAAGVEHVLMATQEADDFTQQDPCIAWFRLIGASPWVSTKFNLHDRSCLGH